MPTTYNREILDQFKIVSCTEEYYKSLVSKDIYTLYFVNDGTDISDPLGAYTDAYFGENKVTDIGFISDNSFPNSSDSYKNNKLYMNVLESGVNLYLKYNNHVYKASSFSAKEIVKNDNGTITILWNDLMFESPVTSTLVSLNDDGYLPSDFIKINNDNIDDHTVSMSKLIYPDGDGETLLDDQGNWKRRIGTINSVNGVAVNVFSGSSGNTASGTSSFAEGAGTVAQGNYSHSEGSDTNAYGYASHAEGSQTHANGLQAHAEGLSTNANGSRSHAEGEQTIATGSHSHAEGMMSKTMADFSHAEGYNCTANGAYSHVGGNESVAIGSYTFAHGNGVQVLNGAAIGNYNTPNPDDLFQVGNGSDSTSRSNAFRVTKDGTAIAKKFELEDGSSIGDNVSGIKINVLTQSEYDAIETKDTTTLYFIKE